MAVVHGSVTCRPARVAVLNSEGFTEILMGRQCFFELWKIMTASKVKLSIYFFPQGVGCPDALQFLPGKHSGHYNLLFSCLHWDFCVFPSTIFYSLVLPVFWVDMELVLDEKIYLFNLFWITVCFENMQFCCKFNFYCISVLFLVNLVDAM